MLERGYTQELDISLFKGCFTLIVGDINSGKTQLSRRILKGFLDDGEDDIIIVDLAPDISQYDLARRGELSGIGGNLEAPSDHAARDNVRRVAAELVPPRLRATTQQEALFYAGQNALIIEGMFRRAFEGKVGILLVNDCSMYLQAGDPWRLLNWIKTAPTAVVNGYYGTRLGAGPVSEREREGMDYLMANCDRLIRL
jgi:energy-coupling factor transporter ATP-binding protein EcfA2